MSVARLIARAERALTDRRFGDAVTYSRELLAMQPDFGPAWHLLAVAATAVRDLPVALTAAQEAARLMPADPEAWRNLGMLRQVTRNPLGALEAFRRAQAMAPDDPEMVAQLGIALVTAGEFDGARRKLQDGLQRWPGRRSLWLVLAETELAAGRYQHAADTLGALHARFPPDARSHAALALVALKQQRRTLAAVQAQAAMQAEPTPTTRFLLARVLAHSRDVADYPRALDLLNTLPSKAVEPGLIEGLTARIELMTSHPAMAKSSAETAIALQPGNAEFWLTGAEAAAARGPLESLAFLSKAGALVQSDPRVLARSGRWLLLSGQAGPALRAALEILHRHPAHAQALNLRAAALLALGKVSEAERDFDIGAWTHVARPAVPADYSSPARYWDALAQSISGHRTLLADPLEQPVLHGSMTDNLLDDEVSAAVRSFAQSVHAAVASWIGSLSSASSPAKWQRPPKRVSLRLFGSRCEARGEIRPHVAEQAWAAGLFFVRVPSGLGHSADEPLGWVELGTPDLPARNWPAPSTRMIKPNTGQLLLYPAHFTARIRPFLESGELYVLHVHVIAGDEDQPR